MASGTGFDIVFILLNGGQSGVSFTFLLHLIVTLFVCIMDENCRLQFAVLINSRCFFLFWHYSQRWFNIFYLKRAPFFLKATFSCKVYKQYSCTANNGLRKFMERHIAVSNELVKWISLRRFENLKSGLLPLYVREGKHLQGLNFGVNYIAWNCSWVFQICCEWSVRSISVTLNILLPSKKNAPVFTQIIFVHSLLDVESCCDHGLSEK